MRGAQRPNHAAIDFTNRKPAATLALPADVTKNRATCRPLHMEGLAIALRRDTATGRQHANLEIIQSRLSRIELGRRLRGTSVARPRKRAHWGREATRQRPG